jgi:hypothetical protein
VYNHREAHEGLSHSTKRFLRKGNGNSRDTGHECVIPKHSEKFYIVIGFLCLAWYPKLQDESYRHLYSLRASLTSLIRDHAVPCRLYEINGGNLWLRVSRVCFNDRMRPQISSTALIPLCSHLQANKEIKLICTDVDGTLLNSSQVLTERTKVAIKWAHDQGVPVRFPYAAASQSLK